MRYNDSWVNERRNQAARLIQDSNRVRNVLRFSKNETKRHALLKFEICYQLAQEEKEFVTEAIWKSGGRGDVVCLDDFIVIECLESETLDEMTSKTSSYPSLFSIEYARFKDGKIERGVVKRC
jgi:hypothetical protein